jgi:hypothetical protein
MERRKKTTKKKERRTRRKRRRGEDGANESRELAVSARGRV